MKNLLHHILVIRIQILPIVSRSKSIQTIEFGQLIEHKMKIIFLKRKYTQTMVEKLFPDPFIINQN